MPLQVNRVQKPVRKIRKLLKKMSAIPNPEEIHDFRTSSRRVESTLQVLPLASGRSGRRTSKALSRLRKRAGKVRDMDVLIGHATNLNQGSDTDADEKDCSIRLLEYLGAQRLKQAKKFHALTEQSGGKLSKRLKRISNKVEKALPATKAGGSDRNASSEAAATALKLVSELATASRIGKGNLHSYRLKVKELQNILKMANDSEHKFVKELGALKDAIGEWHDWDTLVGIAGDVLDHGTQCGLLRELKRKREEKYETALSLFEQTRKKYLQQFNDRGSNSRRNFGKKPAESVLSATAAIAA